MDIWIYDASLLQTLKCDIYRQMFQQDKPGQHNQCNAMGMKSEQELFADLRQGPGLARAEKISRACYYVQQLTGFIA